MLSWINSLEMSCLPDGADKKAIISDQGRQLPVKLASRRNQMHIQLQEQAWDAGFLLLQILRNLFLMNSGVTKN